MEKRFIVRKYIMAESAMDAIKKDRTTPVDDCYVDGAWMAENTRREMGYNAKTTKKN